jgi:MFS family permease
MSLYNSSALVPIGAAFGAVSSGAILGVLSRSQALIMTDTIGIVGLMISEISNLYVLFIARFVIGLAVGLNSSLVPLYIQEFTPLPLSGTMGSMNQFTINFG